MVSQILRNQPGLDDCTRCSTVRISVIKNTPTADSEIIQYSTAHDDTKTKFHLCGHVQLLDDERWEKRDHNIHESIISCLRVAQYRSVSHRKLASIFPDRLKESCRQTELSGPCILLGHLDPIVQLLDDRIQQ